MKIIFYILFFLLTQKSYANMRDCLLLPIHHPANEKLSFKVFEELENYLRTNPWCRYRSNSAILEILPPKKENLNLHLNREDILRLMAQKTNTGSLIKVKIDSIKNGIELSMSVIGKNGRDIYIQKQTIFRKENAYLIAQMVKNWLEEYQQIIPYDGLVVNALGDQFTIDIGSKSDLYLGSEISIFRPGKRRRHPLLKEIVEHDSTPVGEGKISQVTLNQSQGNVIAYGALKSIQVGDWVKVKEHQKREFLQIDAPKRTNTYKFGKIGELGVMLPFGMSTGENSNMLGIGFEFAGELWITRKYWTSFSYGHKFGFLDHQGPNNNSRFRLKAGYRYLPLGFFHGPQINAFLGYGGYQYNLEKKDGSPSFQGFLLGGSCHLPLKKMFALNAELGLMPATRYSDSSHDFSGSGANYYFKLGLSYWYNPRMKFLASFDYANNNASRDNSQEQISVQESRLNTGLFFIF